MGMGKWIREEVRIIGEGLRYDFYKWSALGAGGLVIAVATWIVRNLTWIPAWVGYLIIFTVALSIFFWLTKKLPQKPKQSTAIQAANVLVPNNPTPNFDATDFLKNSYVSEMAAEIEQNVRTAARVNSPNSPEEFYIQLITRGLPGYIYDVLWAYIFKSQISALCSLVATGPVLPKDMKHFYDTAAMEYPDMYANYSFDRWLEFMRSNLVILWHPDGRIGSTQRGRDFLKYLAHSGRLAEHRKF
jgi:hypothetical protein